MSFKIGDRVKLNFPESPYNGRVGIIKMLPCLETGGYVRVDLEATTHEPPYLSLWAEDKLELEKKIQLRIYRGDCKNISSSVQFSDDNKNWNELDPEPSQRVRYHSPDGFNFGYNGSGPLQLSLALLLEVAEPAKALRYYKRFCTDIVSKLNDSWTLTTGDLLETIQGYESQKPRSPLVLWLSGQTAS